MQLSILKKKEKRKLINILKPSAVITSHPYNILKLDFIFKSPEIILLYHGIHNNVSGDNGNTNAIKFNVFIFTYTHLFSKFMV